MKRGLPQPVDLHISEQAALYSLGMLPLPEAREFEEMVAESCEEYAAVLKSFESVVACIGLGVAEHSPSLSVREKLFSRIAADCGMEMVYGYDGLRTD